MEGRLSGTLRDFRELNRTKRLAYKERQSRWMYERSQILSLGCRLQNGKSEDFKYLFGTKFEISVKASITAY